MYSQDAYSNPFDNAQGTDRLASPPASAKPIIPSHTRQISDAGRSWSDRDRSPDTLGHSTCKASYTMEEKQWQNVHKHKRQESSTDTRHKLCDPEKMAYTSPRSSQPSRDNLSIRPSTHSISSIQAIQAQHACRILFFLSGTCVALSFVSLLWALLSVLFVTILLPVRLCTSNPPFGKQLCHFLAPMLNIHLRCIYSPGLPRTCEDDDTYSAGGLVFVHSVAPIVALGIAVASWIVAVYWGLARIVGDPSGIDKRDDGVEAVLSLRRWWERFLLMGANT